LFRLCSEIDLISASGSFNAGNVHFNVHVWGGAWGAPVRDGLEGGSTLVAELFSLVSANFQNNDEREVV
jgi:hypothetical protein